MADKNTRNNLIEKGAEIIYVRGFDNTGINKGKEGFGVQLVDHFLIRFIPTADAYQSHASDSWARSLKSFSHDFLVVFESNGFKSGRPIANFSLEMSDFRESVRKKLKEAFGKMNDKVAAFLEKARKNGDLPDSLDPGKMCSFMLNSLEGALSRIKASKGHAPMDFFESHVFDNLLKKGG